MVTLPYRMWLDDENYTVSRAVQEIYAFARERGDFDFETIEAITSHLQTAVEVLEIPIAMSFSILAWALLKENHSLDVPTLLAITTHLRRIHAHDTIPVLVRRHQTQAFLEYQRNNDEAFRNITQIF